MGKKYRPAAIKHRVELLQSEDRLSSSGYRGGNEEANPDSMELDQIFARGLDELDAEEFMSDHDPADAEKRR